MKDYRKLPAWSLIEFDDGDSALRTRVRCAIIMVITMTMPQDLIEPIAAGANEAVNPHHREPCSK
jgi:hypothetical protein